MAARGLPAHRLLRERQLRVQHQDRASARGAQRPLRRNRQLPLYFPIDMRVMNTLKTAHRSSEPSMLTDLAQLKGKARKRRPKRALGRSINRLGVSLTYDDTTVPSSEPHCHFLCSACIFPCVHYGRFRAIQLSQSRAVIPTFLQKQGEGAAIGRMAVRAAVTARKRRCDANVSMPTSRVSCDPSPAN